MAWTEPASGIVGMLPERHTRLRMTRRFMESGIDAPQKPYLWKFGGLSQLGGGFCFGFFERCPERGMRAQKNRAFCGPGKLNRHVV